VMGDPVLLVLLLEPGFSSACDYSLLELSIWLHSEGKYGKIDMIVFIIRNLLMSSERSFPPALTTGEVHCDPMERDKRVGNTVHHNRRRTSFGV